jgi:hypothetical protein
MARIARDVRTLNRRVSGPAPSKRRTQRRRWRSRRSPVARARARAGALRVADGDEGESPTEMRRLDEGKHKFKVRAIDAAGNVGAAEKDTFRVID